MAVTPSRAWIAMRLRWSKVMSALSPLPLLWLEHQDSIRLTHGAPRVVVECEIELG